MLVIALLVFATILVVGYPLVNAQNYQFETMTNGDDRLGSLIGARDSVYDAIRDLEFDHNTGKLSDEDYRQMRARYDVQAAEVLQKMDALAAKSKSNHAGDKVNGQAGAGRSSCPKCHAKVQGNDRFCPKCGTRLV